MADVMWSYPGATSVVSGPECVEGRLVADLELEVDVLLDLVHGDVARAFDHHLHVVLPRDLGELAERPQLGQLGLVVGVGDRPGRRPSPSEKATS